MQAEPTLHFGRIDVFQLTAEAWSMLAAQVETLEDAQGSESISTPTLIQSTA
jgi:hypothetical protein